MSLPTQAIESFRTRVRCEVLTPDSPGYDEARRVQNGMIDRRPALIVKCRGNVDVIETVKLAKEHDALLSVRGGGHNVAGNAVNDGGIVIDLSEMRGVHVDPRRKVAHVQGGATWADLDRETQIFGLATPGGLVSTTGVGGLTLHGGFGHLRNKYGLSIDNLLSVDIVTADGELRTASATENADLFWAVRGAGSNFGVVTSFEFQLHPVGPTVVLCGPFYHLNDAPEVMRGWRSLLPTIPAEYTPVAFFWSLPEGFPPEVVGTPVVAAAGVYCGPVEKGLEVIEPFRELATPVVDLSGPMPFTAVQSAFDPFFPKGLLCYWKSTYFETLSDELIDHLCEIAGTRASPRTSMDVWPMLGASSRPSATDTAYGRRAPYMVAFESSWTDPAQSDANIAWARNAYASMKRFDASGVYLNFPGFGEEKEEMVRAAYGANYERLVAIKTKYDPDNLFRMNLNIPPAD